MPNQTQHPRKKNHNKTIFESHSSNEMLFSAAVIVKMFNRENQRGSYNTMGVKLKRN